MRELRHPHSKVGVKKTSCSSAELLEFAWPSAASQDPDVDDLLHPDGEHPRAADVT